MNRSTKSGKNDWMISRRAFLKGIAACGLVASYPIMIERYLVMINHYDLPVKGLPGSFDGFRILHLTDLHYGPLVPFRWLQHILDLAMKEDPDLIVLTGDYVHERNSNRLLQEIWPEFEKLDARYGVKMVLGNHDHWADSDYALDLLESSGRSLRNKAEILRIGDDELILAGVGDYWEDEIRIDDALKGLNPATPRIVLAHNPDTADLPYEEKVDLFLCGHTHGGQVNIPFFGTPVVPVLNKKYNYGIKRSEKSTLFINKGIGWAIYPVRFNCAPEIAILHLKSV